MPYLFGRAALLRSLFRARSAWTTACSSIRRAFRPEELAGRLRGRPGIAGRDRRRAASPIASWRWPRAHDRGRATSSWSGAVPRARPRRSSCASAATTCCSSTRPASRATRSAARASRPRPGGSSGAWAPPPPCARSRAHAPAGDGPHVARRDGVSRATYGGTPGPASPCGGTPSTTRSSSVAARGRGRGREGARACAVLDERRPGHGPPRAERRPAPRRTSAARLVIGADGRRSVVARRLGLLREHRSLRKFAVRGHWDGVQGLGRARRDARRAGAATAASPRSRPTSGNVAFVLRPARDARRGRRPRRLLPRATLRALAADRERLEGAHLLAPPRAIGPLALEARRCPLPARCSWATRPASTIPSPAKASRSRCAAPSWRPRWPIGPCARTATGDLRAYDRAPPRGHPRQVPPEPAAPARSWPGRSWRTPWRGASRAGPILADRLVGIAGDFVPARTAFDLGFLLTS